MPSLFRFQAILGSLPSVNFPFESICIAKCSGKNPSTFSVRNIRSRRRRLRSRSRRAILNRVLSAVCDIELPLSKSPKMSADIGIILLPAQLIWHGFNNTVSFSRATSSAFTTAHPILFVPKSRPRIFFIFIVFLVILPTKVHIFLVLFGTFKKKV